MLANTGSLIQSVGAAWLMAGMASADWVALVQTATFLPMALFAIPAGAIADMYDRRRVQIASLSLSLVGAALMTAAAMLGWMSPWVLLGFCFLIGTGGALFGPAWQTSVGEQVPKELLPQAVGLNGISYNVARSVGPAMGGVIVAAFGASVAFAMNALAYLPILFALKLWKRETEVARLPPEGLLRSVNGGLRYIVHMRPVRRAVLRGFSVCFIGSALQPLLPLMARDLLGGDARTFGLLLGCFGIGAVSGIFVLQRLRERFSNEQCVGGCGWLFAFALIALSLSRHLWLSCIVLLFAGMAWMLMVTILSIALQLFVPRWVAGRAVATLQSFIAFGIAGGAAFWGFVARDHGVAQALLYSAFALLASPLLGLILRVDNRDKAAELDETRLAEPDVKLGIDGRSGPISIEVQYRIDPVKARDFYNLMRQMRSVRKRNGAYDWSLARDIADPWIWAECFRCPTWNDYLRMRDRRTREDGELDQLIRSMHAGDEPIRVRRWLDRPSGSVRWREESPDQDTTELKLP